MVLVWSPDTEDPEPKETRRSASKRRKENGRESRKARLTKRRSFPTQNRLEDPHQRFGELILEVVGCIDGDVVLEDVDRIFGLVVGGGT